jgi:hypothetical protein
MKNKINIRPTWGKTIEGKEKDETLNRCKKEKINERCLLTMADLNISQSMIESLGIDTVIYGDSLLHTRFNTILQKAFLYKYLSLEDLNVVLRQYQMTAIVQNGNPKRRQAEMLVYYEIKADGGFDNYSIAGQQLAGDYSLMAMESRITNNQRRFEIDFWEFRYKRYSIFSCKTGSFDEFKQKMKLENISVISHPAKTGTGKKVWMIDHQTRFLFDVRKLWEESPKSTLFASFIERNIPHEALF